MTESKESRRIFESARDHLNEASLANSAALDKAVLTLSSAALALSLSFSSTIIPISSAECIGFLKFSWILFVTSILSTVVAFITSNSAISVERTHIYKYYIEESDSYGEKSNFWGMVTYGLNRLSAASFILGVLLLVSYAWVNIPPTESSMKEGQNQSIEKKGYVPPKKEPKPPKDDESTNRSNK